AIEPRYLRRSKGVSWRLNICEANGNGSVGLEGSGLSGSVICVHRLDRSPKRTSHREGELTQSILARAFPANWFLKTPTTNPPQLFSNGFANNIRTRPAASNIVGHIWFSIWAR